MDALRWILLAAGVLLIIGLYVWGLRSNRRSASRPAERAARVDPPVASRSQSAPRIEPGLGAAGDAATDEPPGPGRSEEADVAPVRSGPAVRREPRIEAQAPPPTTAGLRPAARAATEGEGAEAAAPANKIIAVRIVAPPPETFAGAALREAIEQEGLVFGRYQIFHRLDPAGEPVFSLASLREPGTFDLATMEQGTFRGVAMFTVLPGPLPGADALDALIESARAIAGRLGGLLQDERGMALGVVRVGQLRESAAPYAPARAATPGG